MLTIADLASCKRMDDIVNLSDQLVNAEADPFWGNETKPYLVAVLGYIRFCTTGSDVVVQSMLAMEEDELDVMFANWTENSVRRYACVGAWSVFRGLPQSTKISVRFSVKSLVTQMMTQVMGA